jgi:phage terminase large subunit GpA-like protein
MAKDILFARLRVAEQGPRHQHFPKGHGYDEEFFQQLTAEALKTRYSHGFPEQFYEKVRDRNEALDRRVYFLAGLDILKPNLTAIAKHLKADPAPAALREYQLQPGQTGPNPPAQAKAPAPARRPRGSGGGFIGRWRK